MNKLIAHSSELVGKKQTQKIIFITIAFMALMFKQSLAQTVSSTELINHAKELDGKTVVYQGEVIGDLMRRGKFAWANIHDGQNAIGIWIASELTNVIAYTGDYKTKGDIVEIKGIFNRACPEHGADLDIHAKELRIIDSGYLKRETIDPLKRNAAFILLGVLGLIWILNLLKRK